MEKLSHLSEFLKLDQERTFLFSGLLGNFPWQHISQGGLFLTEQQGLLATW